MTEHEFIERVAAGIRRTSAQGIVGLVTTSEGLPWPIECVCGIPIFTLPATVLAGEDSCTVELLVVPVFAACNVGGALVRRQRFIDGYEDMC